MKNKNPISREEKEKMVKYCNKIEGREAFTMEELEDYINTRRALSCLLWTRRLWKTGNSDTELTEYMEVRWRPDELFYILVQEITVP